MKRPQTNMERLNLAIACLRPVVSSLRHRCPEGMTNGQTSAIFSDVALALSKIESVAGTLNRIAMTREANSNRVHGRIA